MNSEVPIATEVELKLAIPTTGLPKAERALLALAGQPQGRARRLVTSYYDTPDFLLRRSGFSLRVRETDGRFVQTLKSLHGDGSLERGEWEDEIAGPLPDQQAIESGKRLPENSAGNLVPIFATVIERTAIDIVLNDASAVTVAIDRGEIRSHATAAVLPVSEIELELNRGDVTALYDIALFLVEVVAIRIQFASKAGRGYALTTGTEHSPAPVRPEPIPLSPAISADEAFAVIGFSCLQHLMRNEKAVLARLPEGVHQMRIALRRFNSAVSAFKKILPQSERDWLSDELRELTAVLGRARNLDVFASDLLVPCREALAQEVDVAPLSDAIAELRAAAYDEIEEVIRSPLWTAKMLRLLRWFQGRKWRADAKSLQTARGNAPLGGEVLRLLDRRRHAVKRRSQGFADLGPKRRHKLRIAVKKLRYTIELLSSLFAGEVWRDFERRMKRLQDDLGYANDVRVGRKLISDIASAGNAAAEAAALVLEWHKQALATAEPRISKHLKLLNKAAPFWRAPTAWTAMASSPGDHASVVNETGQLTPVPPSPQ